VLASQSEIDSHAVNSSYAILNVFIWAIPILGFIGTVQGLGSAVGSLGIQDTANVEGIKESLGTITGGLGVAFDTTLVALIMSLMLKFPASSLQKAEEDLLNWVDEYCNENLLKRLKEEPEDVAPSDTISQRIQKSIDASMAAHHAELRTWTQKLSEIGSTLTDQILKGWSSIQGDLQKQHAQRLLQVNEAVAGMSRVVERLGAAATQLSEMQQAQTQQLTQTAEAIDGSVRNVEQRADEHLGRLEANFGQTLEQTRQALAELTAKTEAAHRSVTDSTRDSAEAAQRWMEGMQKGVEGLNQVLGELGEKQVIVRTEAAPRRGWNWFGRGKR
jgi:hypothetical protein